VKNGSSRILDELPICDCSLCSMSGCDRLQDKKPSSDFMNNAYQRVVRCILANEVIFSEVNFGISSHVNVRNGIPSHLVRANDCGNKLTLEAINRSKMEEIRSVPSVCNEILIHTDHPKRLPIATRTVFVARGLTEKIPTRFLTLSQFKSILSDNRKHAKSIWKDFSHISLCPWSLDDDSWRTIILKFDPSISSGANDSADVSQCRKICHSITKLLQEEENSEVISGIFTFYHSSSESQHSVWWLTDISKLQIACTVPDESHDKIETH
jgi:hypothetical protein